MVIDNYEDSIYSYEEDNSYYKKVSFYTPPDILEKESYNEILSNLILTWAGCYTKAAGHVVNNRLLQDYVLIYCVDGIGWLELQERRWEIKKGDFFICPANISHSYGADNKNPWTKYWVHFRGKSSYAYVSLLGLTISSPILHIGENVKILSMLQDIFNILKTGYSQSNLILATSYLANILSYVNSYSLNTGINRIQNINVEKIISYMLENLNGNLSLEQLSDVAQSSKYHFVRIFKEKTGYSPVNYFIRLKMQKACELLESSAVKIGDISSALGFNNPYYFSVTFKRVVGKSPQRYRQML